MSQQKRKTTHPGLGQEMAEGRRTISSEREAQPARVESRPPSGTRETRSGPPPVDSRPKERRETPAPASAQRSGARRTTVREDRPAVSVDHVGNLSERPDAMSLSTRGVPRVSRSKAEISAAPIDHRAGFLLAYIDGSTTVQGLIDIGVMPETEVHEILDRLRRLGIVTIR
jgi:hypothetical protein